jgi:hypothetical protein
MRNLAVYAEIAQAEQSVLAGNTFGTTAQPGNGCEQLAKLAFRSEPYFGATVLSGHAELRPFCKAADRFDLVRDINQFGGRIGVSKRPKCLIDCNHDPVDVFVAGLVSLKVSGRFGDLVEIELAKHH